ncbi:MAG TPA: tetratricopeptide repeat protein [Pyrinomonadaceae bacterium]|jgi:tetratricopeptide (TPR) repeat protein
MKSTLCMMIVLLSVALSGAGRARAQGGGEGAGAAQLERAAALISGDRLQEAERVLESALKARPDDALALNLLGTVRAKQGRLEEAEALFSRAVRADAAFVGAHMNLAYLYTLRGAPEKTAAELREVMRLDPHNADAAYKLARTLCGRGSFAECASVAEGARAAGALTPPLALMLGDAYARLGDAAKAEESYMLPLGAKAEDADALVGAANAALAVGSPRAAAVYLARVRGRLADAPAPLYRFGVLALKAGLYDDAKRALERASQLDPKEPSHLVALGAVWFKKPDLFEAEKAFRRALELKPEDPQAQMYLGYTLLKQKRLPEARGLLEKSARGDASTPETFYYLGLIAQEQNEDARAVEYFERAVKLLPSYAQAHVALGAVYLKQKNYERARASLEEGVRLDPEDSKAHYNLARLYAQLKEPQKARAEMEAVERLKGAGGARPQGEDAPPPGGPR